MLEDLQGELEASLQAGRLSLSRRMGSPLDP